MSETVVSRTVEFDNRLTLAEAAAMVQSSARAGEKPGEPGAVTPPSPIEAPVRINGRAVSLTSASPLPAAMPASGSDRRTVKDYVVKGASPGLAVLAALNPLPGSTSVIELGVGDAVPGVGKVRRVYQRGTTWVVETDNGSIQP